MCFESTWYISKKGLRDVVVRTQEGFQKLKHHLNGKACVTFFMSCGLTLGCGAPWPHSSSSSAVNQRATMKWQTISLELQVSQYQWNLD